MEFSDWDKAVMKIEEVFAAYQPEERNKLRDKVFDDIERGTGTDTQKQQARGAIETALENVENVPWIKNLRILEDRTQIYCTLNDLTHIECEFPFEDVEQQFKDTFNEEVDLRRAFEELEEAREWKAHQKH